MKKKTCQRFWRERCVENNNNDDDKGTRNVSGFPVWPFHKVLAENRIVQKKFSIQRKTWVFGRPFCGCRVRRSIFRFFFLCPTKIIVVIISIALPLAFMWHKLHVIAWQSRYSISHRHGVDTRETLLLSPPRPRRRQQLHSVWKTAIAIFRTTHESRTSEIKKKKQ